MSIHPPFRAPLALLAGLALATLAACSSDDDKAVDVAVIGDPGAPFVTAGRLPFAAELVRAATVEGLVALDEEGRVVPAVADRWIVTDDGMSYIFRLRDGTWPDGSPITGETARAALVQAIGALRGRAFGDDLAAIEEVRAMAGRVVEIRLSQQSPDLLQLLAQPELGLAWRGRGAGPMQLARKKGVATLSPIPPEDRGLPQQADWQERRRKLRLVALPAQQAIDRFNTGEVDFVLGGQFQDFPRLDASGVARGALRFDPVSGLFGLAIEHRDGFFDLPENREALAMAIDRDGIATALGVGGWLQTTRIVNPGSGDDNGSVGERWQGRSQADRRAEAAARVARWKAAHKLTPLRIALPAGPGADALFRRLSADYTAIGLEVQRVRLAAEADLRLVDSVARYARIGWYLNQLSCQVAPAACNPAADRLAIQARSEPDPAKRNDLYAQAEAQLTMANGYIPFGAPIRWSVVSGNATGFMVNRRALHPLMPMAMRPK
ncbi:ABC transporter substrate-binding protein [Novosphingobium sp. B 225]|uniref:ABC transporter substrate-binding protein n=1 Tax=Novosphingobium sp. B 225 TaxID=1961849 RepID=UPI0020CF1230|nr:ABC transporter substrate-binding protein [Novosphingobium sp. B 225]